MGIVRRTFKGFLDPSCYAAVGSEALLPFIDSMDATPCNVRDTQSIAGFFPGQRILTITKAGVGCFETWTNGSHFLEQGNQKTDSRNYQLTSACPLCRNCAAVTAACAGQCSVNGSLQCLDACIIVLNCISELCVTNCAVPLGHIGWNYRCYGSRDASNNLERVRAGLAT